MLLSLLGEAPVIQPVKLFRIERLEALLCSIVVDHLQRSKLFVYVLILRDLYYVLALVVDNERYPRNRGENHSDGDEPLPPLYHASE